MISIITPVYNASKFIMDTIAMVQAQTYRDWELILVENGSTDGTKEILQQYMDSADMDRRIRIYIFGTLEGKAAGARNFGLKVAGGRYIAYLDADDIWIENKLEIQLKVMEEEKCGFLFSAYEFGDSEGRPCGKVVHVPHKLDFQHALSRTVIFTSTTLFDTEKVPKYLLEMPYIGSEDTATWWTILKTGIVATGLDQVLVVYRRPEKSLSSNKLLAIKRMWILLREVAGLDIFNSICALTGWAYRASARRIIKNGDRDES